MSLGRGRSPGRLGCQSSHRQPGETAADLVVGAEHQVAELVQRLDPFLRRRAAGDPEHADRFDVTVTALWTAQRLTRQRRPSRRHGVDWIGLALASTQLSVRPIDLDDADPGAGQMSAQASSIRAGALDPNQTVSPWQRSHSTNCS